MTAYSASDHCENNDDDTADTVVSVDLPLGVCASTSPSYSLPHGKAAPSLTKDSIYKARSVLLMMMMIMMMIMMMMMSEGG